MSIVIITGGAGGVGQEVVRLLSERGDRVWLTYNRSEERARDLIAKASGSPGLVNARQVNLEAAVETERFVKEVLSEETRVDGFVHCATSVYDAPITGLDFERTAAVTEVMLWSFARIAKLILPRMRRQRYGRLVAVSSLAAHRSSVGNGVYSAAKAALESLVRTIAVECGPKGVAACAIAPGLVNTDLIAKYTRMESIVGRVPLRRMAEPAEIARFVALALAEESGYLNGTTVSLDGGLSTAL